MARGPQGVPEELTLPARLGDDPVPQPWSICQPWCVSCPDFKMAGLGPLRATRIARKCCRGRSLGGVHEMIESLYHHRGERK